MKISVTPAPLKKGDTVGIIAPAGRLTELHRFERGIHVLREMGFQVKLPRDLWTGHEYLADSDKNRGIEFNQLLRDPAVHALVCLRGGYGCLRMLERIDLDLVASQMKMIVGFSDITILLNYLYEKTGLISLHGPVVTSLGDADVSALERFFRSLSGRWDEPVRARNIEILQHGSSCIAPLVGGNLASLTSLCGTPYDFPWDDKIVFLEDINEPAYKVDRMLTQLHLTGKFAKVAGIILGDFSGVSLPGDITQQQYLDTIWTRVLQLCGDRKIPVWGNFPCGHCQRNLTLPVGAPAQMDGRTGQLLFPSSRTVR